MVMCVAPDCKHYSEQKICKFFSFPKDPSERRRWISLIRRQDWEPSKYSLICSCHFINNEKSNGPTIFNYNIGKKVDFPSPVKRRRKASIQCPDDACVATSSTSVSTRDLEEAGPSTFTYDHAEPGSSTKDHAVCDSEKPTNLISVNKLCSASLEAENYFLKQELDELKQQLKRLNTRFSYDHIKNNDMHVLMYTGIPNNGLFLSLCELMSSFEVTYYAGWQVKLMSKTDQIFMTLMKLRLNMPHEDLAVRFACSSTTVTNIIMTWIYALHKVLFEQLMDKIPSRQKNQACLPGAFDTFKNCRIILDCTEIFSATPSKMDNQRLTYSSYKHRNTWKVLVGVAPNGVITYVSQAYPGSASDKKIVEHCGVLQQMVSGDLVLADKGFLIRDLLPPGVSLNIPPFLNTPQFTSSQVYETTRIAKARIHVERAIRRIKCYNILQHVPPYYMSEISVIFQLCAALTNFQYPLIKEVQEYYC